MVTEKDQYAKIIKLHPKLPKIFRHAANDEGISDALSYIVSNLLHICAIYTYVPLLID